MAREVERKYDVPPGFALPSLEQPGWLVADGGTVHLSATYYDTGDLRLAAAKTTLRRRTGGKDAGWHLKVPSEGEREEIGLPLDDGSDVPLELAERVQPHTGGAPLQPVARLDTTRTIRTVTATDGTPLVEVVDDLVRSQRLGPDGDGGAREWREVEAELLTDSHDEALAEVGRLLTEAGATPAGHASKLALALGLS
jgi:inorganic triphosphatase YgiF